MVSSNLARFPTILQIMHGNYRKKTCICWRYLLMVPGLLYEYVKYKQMFEYYFFQFSGRVTTLETILCVQEVVTHFI